MRNRHVLGVGLVAALLQAPMVLAANESQVETRLSPSLDAPAFADGQARYRDRGTRADLRVEIEDVPVGSYALFVGGVYRGTAMVGITSTGTEGELEFRLPAEPGKLALNFDPRGEAIEWRFDGKAVLAGTLPSATDLDPGNVYEQVVEWGQFGRSTNAPMDAGGSIQLKSNKKKADLRLRLEGLEGNTEYVVTADGLEVATIRTKKNGKAKLTLSTKAKGKKLPLEFDPAQAVFEVWNGNERALTAPLNATAIGGGLKPPGRVVVQMSNLGVDGDASGEAQLRERKDRVDFQVEVEDLQAGSYDLLVDGVAVGSMDVALRSDGSTRGEIEFSTQAGEMGKLALGFDPAGALLEVVQGDTVYLAIVFPE